MKPRTLIDQLHEHSARLHDLMYRTNGECERRVAQAQREWKARQTQTNARKKKEERPS